MSSLNMIWRNEQFVVLHKPCGILTVPSHQGRADPRPVLGILLQEALATKIYPVHRLDVEVSGLVLFALNPDAHRIANRWFEQHLVQKTYRAWTTTQGFGHIPANITNPRQPLTLSPQQQFDWHGRIERGKRRAYPSPHGKPSHTHAIFLGQNEHNGFLEWDLLPITGRPHQLRVDLSRQGFPIIGDKLYGSDFVCTERCIALVAWQLNFRNIAPSDRLGLPENISIPPQCPDCQQTYG